LFVISQAQASILSILSSSLIFLIADIWSINLDRLQPIVWSDTLQLIVMIGLAFIIEVVYRVVAGRRIVLEYKEPL
jgi:hypothetical protein